MAHGASRKMFHDGERAVQQRVGAERMAAQIGRNIVSGIPFDYARFLAAQPFVVVAGRDAQARMWASLIGGGVGFARVLDDRRLLLAGALPPHDPLVGAFEPPGGPIGILAIEADTRRRIRLNGVAERRPDGLLVTVEEAFGNCPKFIARRVPAAPLEPPPGARHRSGTELDPRQVVLLRAADTFFIATSHRQRGADASHRGGLPGFVEVGRDRTSLRFPDYPGNRMFQTLGNLTVDPSAGLLFLDWHAGSTLALTGRARIVWDEEEVNARPGAERLVDVDIVAVHEHEGALPARWTLLEHSPFNPPVRIESFLTPLGRHRSHSQAPHGAKPF